MMKPSDNDPSKFAYQAEPEDIVIITEAIAGYYDFHVYKKRTDALTDLYNAWLCNYTLIHCSDEDIEKEHQRQIADAPPRYGDDIPVVDEKGLFHANT